MVTVRHWVRVRCRAKFRVMIMLKIYVSVITRDWVIVRLKVRVRVTVRFGFRVGLVLWFMLPSVLWSG